jgi:hypothetical protein
VIKFYTDPGEDATLAIQQFHHRSINQVLAMMKALPKRPAQDRIDHSTLNFELWTLLMCQTISSILYTVFQIGTKIRS